MRREGNFQKRTIQKKKKGTLLTPCEKQENHDNFWQRQVSDLFHGAGRERNAQPDPRTMEKKNIQWQGTEVLFQIHLLVISSTVQSTGVLRSKNWVCRGGDSFQSLLCAIITEYLRNTSLVSTQYFLLGWFHLFRETTVLGKIKDLFLLRRKNSTGTIIQQQAWMTFRSSEVSLTNFFFFISIYLYIYIYIYKIDR